MREFRRTDGDNFLMSRRNDDVAVEEYGVKSVAFLNARETEIIRNGVMSLASFSGQPSVRAVDYGRGCVVGVNPVQDRLLLSASA